MNIVEPEILENKSRKKQRLRMAKESILNLNLNVLGNDIRVLLL